MANITEVRIPDIGGATQVDVIEVLVKPGDTISKEDSLVTLEGDKATMEVPSPVAGVVKEIKIKVGDKVSEGSLILTAESEATAEKTPAKEAPKPAEPKKETTPTSSQKIVQPITTPEVGDAPSSSIHAGPAVRRMLREFELDVKAFRGTGPKGRITKDDVVNYVKNKLKGGGNGLGFNLPKAPSVDFSKFGEIETQVLSKIQKISGPALHRNWLQIPHITQTIEADITEMERFRQEQKTCAEQQGVRLTPLVYIMKAVVAALKEYPKFNSSLAENGTEIILKHYFHIGIAVDTPHGLVVPVIRDVDQKTVFDLAKELGAISKKARETGLSMAEMSGGCFTISSLGGIGGSFFTPIVNAPEVAILGVSRSDMKPVYDKEAKNFIPRLMLPLSLSYDHRVIDGAEGARFITYLAKQLADVPTWIL